MVYGPNSVVHLALKDDDGPWTRRSPRKSQQGLQSGPKQPGSSRGRTGSLNASRPDILKHASAELLEPRKYAK